MLPRRLTAAHLEVCFDSSCLYYRSPHGDLCKDSLHLHEISWLGSFKSRGFSCHRYAVNTQWSPFSFSAPQANEIISCPPRTSRPLDSPVCSSLLAGLLTCATRPLQISENAASHLIFKRPHAHAFLLGLLHRLTVNKRIRHQILPLTYCQGVQQEDPEAGRGSKQGGIKNSSIYGLRTGN